MFICLLIQAGECSLFILFWGFHIQGTSSDFLYWVIEHQGTVAPVPLFLLYESTFIHR